MRSMQQQLGNTTNITTSAIRRCSNAISVLKQSNKKRLLGRGSNTVLSKYKENAVSVDPNCLAGTDVKKLQDNSAIFMRFPKITKSYNWLRHVCPSAWNNSAPTGRIFMKFDI